MWRWPGPGVCGTLSRGGESTRAKPGKGETLRSLTAALPRLLVPVLLLVLLAACMDDDDGADLNAATVTPVDDAGSMDTDDAPPTPEPTLTPGPEPTETQAPDDGAPATPEATATRQGAYEIVTGPEHYLYEVRTGDTLESIAGYFDAGDGDTSYLEPGELGQLNDVDNSALEAGMLLAVPLLISHVDALMPENTIAAALGVGEAGNELELLAPSREMIDGYLGQIALYRVALTPADGGQEPGYVMEYWRTDRAALRAGEVQPGAVFTVPAFTIAAGSMADVEAPGSETRETFTRDGVAYALMTFEGAELDAMAHVDLLVTPAGR